jgi:hypothetical protein
MNRTRCGKPNSAGSIAICAFSSWSASTFGKIATEFEPDFVVIQAIQQEVVVPSADRSPYPRRATIAAEINREVGDPSEVILADSQHAPGEPPGKDCRRGAAPVIARTLRT